jgi:hypothetical protein
MTEQAKLNACAIDRHLQSALLRRRGQNRDLVSEALERLSPSAKERLFRVLQELEDEVAHERQKRRRGF